jgi:serine/threonine-protein kinase
MGVDTMMGGRGETAYIPPVDYDDGYPPGRRGGGRRWIPWVLGLVLVAGVVGGVAYYLLGSKGTVFVPQVAGLSETAAEQKLTAAGLHFTINPESSGTVQKNFVIGTNPPEGNSVASNSTVTLNVSTGQAQATVPDLRGKTIADAQTALSGANLQLGQQTTDPACTQTANTIEKQSAAPGTQLAQGKSVDVTICGGTIQVQSVVGDSAATAKQILTQQGFQVTEVPGSGPSQYQNGQVFSQNPTAQTPEPKGTTITIYVQNAATQSPSPSASTSSSGLSSAPPSDTTSPNPGASFP